MRPNTAPLIILSSVAVALCMACTAYGSSSSSSLNSAGSSDPSSPFRVDGALDGSDTPDNRGQREISQATFQHMLAVRSPKYNFGLGKRRYIIESVPGAKRLPQYNFGLGKRGRMDLLDYEEDGLSDWNDGSLIPDDMEEYDVDQERADAEKRATGRYHFGLGKRARSYNFGLGKRPYQGEKRLPNRYNFGLGR